LVVREEADIELPPIGHYATGICFVDEETHVESEAMFQEIAKECSLQVGEATL
jgi:glutamate synthase (NADPH/NADH)